MCETVGRDSADPRGRHACCRRRTVVDPFPGAPTAGFGKDQKSAWASGKLTRGALFRGCRSGCCCGGRRSWLPSRCIHALDGLALPAPGAAWHDVMRRRSPNCGAEFCVLALLRDGERYSFDLVRALENTEGLVTSEGTLYPLLGRLRREGMVQSTWRESASGPPRRYYRITQDGDAALQAFASQRRVPAEADRQPADARGGPGRPRSWPGASRCASTPRSRPPPRPAALIAARCSDNVYQSRDPRHSNESGRRTPRALG